ncbi:MAG TPA: hypothetical protein VKU42_12850 [Candidatus Angelobacter sp.]|jgi:hypothetical protein|nr:hypothetical protein [Candidatus Angelobacter sp.]
MPEISTLKNAVQGVVKKDKLLNALFAGGKSLVVSFSRTFYALWLQLTGMIFVLFTLAGAGALMRQYRADHFADHKRLTVEIIFTLVCLYFTSLSFLKAKRTIKRR